MVPLNFTGRKIRCILFIANARSAAPFNNALSYKCITKTGVSGAAALISSSVGIRPSAN